MTAFTIKLIAITSMLIDHAGAVFDLHFGFRVVGRIAFPLFVYLIACGCRHTKSMEKYMLRLGIFALISEIPFDLAFNQQIDFLNDTNIFYTLWLGVACIYIVQKIRHIPYLWILSFAPVAAAMMAANWFGSDYGARGVLLIFLVWAVSDFKTIQLGIIAAFMFLLYFANVNLLAASLIAVPIIAMANNKLGPPAKWVFYWTYPGHLLLFALIAGL